MTSLRQQLEAREKWIKHWIGEGLAAMEGHLSRDKETGTFAHGEAVTMADICVATQVTGAGFFKVDVAPYPTVMRVATRWRPSIPRCKQ